MSRLDIIIVALALTMLLTNGCGAGAWERPSRGRSMAKAWPQPPAQLQLRYVQSISGPELRFEDRGNFPGQRQFDL